MKKIDKVNRGKSKSQEYPNGRRHSTKGVERAPRSARPKMWLSDCTTADLKKAEIICMDNV